MNRIFCIIGKSGSGKDTIYKKILMKSNSGLVPIIPYTTRPRRIDEKEGLNYFFVTDEQLHIYESNDQILEKREYLTVQGIWNYFTLKFVLEENKDYILITTLDGVTNIINQYGAQTVHVIYLYLDDKERLVRCINRESQQADPNYLEVCRRYIADQEDFSEQRLNEIENINFINTSQCLEKCLKQWNAVYEGRKK